ncbi:hypothetical protein NUW58_g8825 [Xylaria curta]|uniref:Uncharacterized protein n=1 Tax=Xylaria curta TaxID=42375 RepID=A0ACC1N647_9PEZI|nr:hypothetical protein NUW58_g8825 [Xylaria curta]
MPKKEFIGLLTALGLVARFVNGQLEPDCNPLHAECSPNKAWPKDNYYIDFTKETGSPKNWVIANDEVVNFTPRGAEFTYGQKGDAPNMWTDFYILGGRYDVELQIAPGQGIISSAVLWSDIQDEIDWEFSGNQYGVKPFPPPDGKWTVEKNIFAQGKMWDGAATYQRDVVNPTTQFHTYSVEWDENHMNWYVDNRVVRSVQASNTPSGFIFPQSPMKLQLGVWGGGDPTNHPRTIEWAGGEIDMKGVPYTMYSGKITSIDKIQDGCSSPSATASASHTSRKIVKNSPGVEAPTPPAITSGYPVATSPITSKSTPSTSPGSYPVNSPSTTGGLLSSLSSLVLGTSSAISSSHFSTSTPPAGSSSYPVASPSTTGGILSSLSSLVLGTSSATSSSHLSISTSLVGPSSYPVASSSITSMSKPSTGSGSYPVASPSTTGGIPSSLSSLSSLVPGTSSTASSAHFSMPTPPASASSYPVASSSATPKITHSTGPGGYPVVGSPSTTGGILSSLSSLILGTSSAASSNVPSKPSNETYPATHIATSQVSPTGSSVALSSSLHPTSEPSVPSSIGTTTPATTPAATESITCNRNDDICGGHRDPRTWSHNHLKGTARRGLPVYLRTSDFDYLRHGNDDCSRDHDHEYQDC